MKKGIITFNNEYELASLIENVPEKMKNNPTFTNPPAALAELEKEAPEFRELLRKARNRDKEWVAFKNTKKVKVLALLEEVAEYVIATCKGDRGLILSSGFDATDEQKGSVKPFIGSLDVELSTQGEAILHAKNQKGAVAYIHQYATEVPSPNTVWHSEGSTTGDHRFIGLFSDKRYWFRVVAIGRKGQQAFSPVVSRSIQ
jgi:hypothetical protein